MLWCIEGMCNEAYTKNGMYKLQLLNDANGTISRDENVLLIQESAEICCLIKFASQMHEKSDLHQKKNKKSWKFTR